jgi:sugar/nucleoside kinase (ribokinase family)
VNGALLCVGDLNADIVIVAPSGVQRGSDSPGHVALSAGGSAANVAAWAARAGASSRFVGAVGDDDLGRFLVERLADDGVDVRAIVRTDASSRAIAAFVGPDADRSMISSLDPATVVTVDDVDTRGDSWFDGVDWLHLTGYTYLQADGPAVVRRLIAAATDLGIAWSFDPSSSAMLEANADPTEVRSALTGVSVIFPNGDEAAWLSGVEDPVDAATALLDVAECVVVTCGDAGAVVARRERDVVHIDAVPVDVVSTLGCGDAFAGGFLAARIAGFDDDCAARGAVTAAGAASIASSR